MKIVCFLEVNCGGQKVNCVGLCDLTWDKIFRIPLPVKVNIEFL